MGTDKLLGKNPNSEKKLEPKLRQKVYNKGGLCLKWVSPGFNGVPDRIVLMPGARIDFIELKSEGEEPRKLQVYVHGLLRKLGFNVYVIDNDEDLNKYIETL